MRHIVLASAFLLACCATGAEPVREALWAGHAPDGNGGVDNADAFITVYRPTKPTGAGIVICPGGGYGMLCTQPEGTGIAEWLGRHGIAGIVLEYRLPAGRCRVPLLDAQRALRTVRARCREFDLDPGRIGVMGFSAGGHLAATLATQNDAGDAKAKDPIARVGCRPDFAVLVYPVITMREGTHGGSRQNLLGDHPSEEIIQLFSTETQVTAKTPPTYLAHAVDDHAVPIANSRAFAAACTQAKVAVRLLELPSGDHGLNGYHGPMWDAWQSGCLAWLAEGGVTAAKR